MRLNQAIQTYLDYLRDERQLSNRTVRGYGYELRLFAAGMGEDKDVKTIDRDQVLGFLNRPGPDGAPLRPTSRNRKLIVLRGLFKYLERENLVEEEDAPTYQIKWVKVPQIEAPCLTWNDYQALLDSFPENNPTWLQIRDRTLIQVLFHTGIRVHELVSIQMNQVDLSGGVLTGLKRKGNSIQTLPLNRVVVAELRRWMEVREQRQPLTDHLFLTRYRRGMTVRQVQRRLTDLGKHAGVAIPVTPHALRHLHATALLERNVNLEVVRRLMNHKSIKTTQRYSHVGFDALKEAVERLCEDSD